MATSRILCIRNDPSDSLGMAPQLLRGAGCDFDVLDAFDANARWPATATLTFPPDLPPPQGEGRVGVSRIDPLPAREEPIRGLVVFGGEMNADELERFPYLLRVRQLMQEAVDQGIPTLGICLGAQLLARACGASVTRAPVRELGFKPIWPTAAAANDPVLGFLEAGDRFFQWHEDTFGLPAGATLLATGLAVRHQAYRLGDRAWGIQFHPEVDAAQIDTWLSQAEATLEPVWGRAAEAVREETRAYLAAQERQARALFGAFARVLTQGEPVRA